MSEIKAVWPLKVLKTNGIKIFLNESGELLVKVAGLSEEDAAKASATLAEVSKALDSGKIPEGAKVYPFAPMIPAWSHPAILAAAHAHKVARLVKEAAHLVAVAKEVAEYEAKVASGEISEDEDDYSGEDETDDS
jgi:hypothetical protein